MGWSSRAYYCSNKEKRELLIPIKFVICGVEYGPVGPVGATRRVVWTRKGPVIIAGWTHGGGAASCRRLRVLIDFETLLPSPCFLHQRGKCCMSQAHFILWCLPGPKREEWGIVVIVKSFGWRLLTCNTIQSWAFGLPQSDELFYSHLSKLVAWIELSKHLPSNDYFLYYTANSWKTSISTVGVWNEIRLTTSNFEQE